MLGEAGVGKSRLVAELAAESARCGKTVLLGRSYESEQTFFNRLAMVMKDNPPYAADGPALERLKSSESSQASRSTSPSSTRRWPRA